MMKKRIAVIFEDDIYCQRGLFNAVRNRVKHLSDISDFDVDVYVIGHYEPWYVRLLRKTAKVKKIKSIVLDGIKYNALWQNFTLTDYLLEVKLHRPAFFSNIFYKNLVNKIQGYDLLSVHAEKCALVASRVSKRDGTPFCVTWHGSEIHTLPFRRKYDYSLVKGLLDGASCNFFVSENLRRIGLTISPNMKSELLYNGRNKMFYRFSEEERNQLLLQYHVPLGTKIVAFVGNLMEVKNPQLLAPIFASIKSKFDKAVSFWVIGSGKMQNDVEKECHRLGVECTFWGGQPADQMPNYMNCIDVLVLPSRNEGLPLVVVEAIACGANVVGSDVGGIAEAIGKENVFTHGETFIDDVSGRIVYMLNNKVKQSLSPDFEWENTAQKELTIYKRLLNIE